MALTAQDVTQLQQALKPQFDALGNQITTLAEGVKENTQNQRNSVQQLFDMDRAQAAEIRRVEKDAADQLASLDKETTEKINTVAVALRKETDEKVAEAVGGLEARIDKSKNNGFAVWALLFSALGLIATVVIAIVF
jgi:hypothetical protein